MSGNNYIDRDDDDQYNGKNWTGWFGGTNPTNSNMNNNGNIASPVASSSSPSPSSGWFCSPISTGGGSSINEPATKPNNNSSVLSTTTTMSGRVTPPLQSDFGGSSNNNGGGCFSWFTTNTNNNNTLSNQYGDGGGQKVDNNVGGTETPSIIPADDLVSQIAKELSSLSVEGRNELHEEIHGIATIPPEDPDEITKKLQQLDIELSKHATVFQTSPYEKAMKLNPVYVAGKPFRLMFLRAYGYNPEVAAIHTLRHFEWKYQLFVEDRRRSRRRNGDTTTCEKDDISILGRPVTLNDLDEVDMKFLQKGVMLFAPGTDMAGRRVFVVSANLVNAPGETFHNLLRIMFYQINDALWRNENMEQQKGMVITLYTLNWTLLPDEGEGQVNTWKLISGQYMKNMGKMPSFRKSLPYRFAAFHFCCNSSIINTCFELNKKMCEKETRLRYRNHYGSHLEVQYHLMSYGIHPAMLPIDRAGHPRPHLAQRYIDLQRMKDEHTEGTSLSLSSLRMGTKHSVAARNLTPTSKRVSKAKQMSVPATVTPTSGAPTTFIYEDDITSNDVLLGRGIPIQSHEGNLKLAILIEKYADDHKSGSRVDKVFLTWKILKAVKEERGGRFLEKVGNDKKVDCYWREVDDNVARAKVSYGFRTYSKMQKQRQKW